MLKRISYFTSIAIIANVSIADNTLNVLTSKQRNLSKTMNRVADMVANVNTTAFKSESDIYDETIKRTDPRNQISFDIIKTTKRNYSQGDMITTARELDVAIYGNGFLSVETPWGIRYTRSGNLNVTPEGLLVTKEGYPVLTNGGGTVEFAQGDINIDIAENGLVRSNGEERGQIGLFEFENTQLLVKQGKGLYKTTEPALEPYNSIILQGVLESSNVSSVESMANLIEVSRRIESNKKLSSELHNIKLESIRKLTGQ